MRTRIENNNLENLAALRERVSLYSTWNLPTRPHTGIFIKINKFVQKISIMLFSNVLFSRIRKKIQKSNVLLNSIFEF